MMTPYMASLCGTGIVRLNPGLPEPNRARRPHQAATIDTIGALVTGTTLPFREIGRRTGTSAATVSRKARRGAIADVLLRRAERRAFETEMDPRATRRQLETVARLVRLTRALDAE